ncbi:IS200/IS605 family transposase [Sodaliphilus sp.]|uniref:IS200/IS605 family transposase n=1 Tax=Sodaliphilus sp. TaxID=2815818 RepID=UPI0038906DEA
MSRYCFLYHIVFRTKGSMLTIDERHEKELYGYIHQFCNNKQSKLYRIGGMPDHIHMLVSIHPSIAVATFVQILKTETSKWLKESPSFPIFCGWAEGYAAFTYAYRDFDKVKGYIMRQKEHHHSFTLAQEYNDLLAEFQVNPSDDYFLRD